MLVVESHWCVPFHTFMVKLVGLHKAEGDESDVLVLVPDGMYTNRYF